MVGSRTGPSDSKAEDRNPSARTNRGYSLSSLLLLAFLSLPQELPAVSTSPLMSLPSILTDSFKLETPLLYSDWKREQMKPFRFTFPDPDSSPFLLLDSSMQSPPQSLASAPARPAGGRHPSGGDPPHPVVDPISNGQLTSS